MYTANQKVGGIFIEGEGDIKGKGIDYSWALLSDPSTSDERAIQSLL